eukprot:jgi/Hompol1/1306/HPOL_000531-RA
MFTLAASLKPIFHLIDLSKDHTEQYKLLAHFPPSKIDAMQSRIDGIEARLSSISRVVESLPTFEQIAAVQATSQQNIDSVANGVTRIIKQMQRKEANSMRLFDESIMSLESKISSLDETSAILSAFMRESGKSPVSFDAVSQHVDKGAYPVESDATAFSRFDSMQQESDQEFVAKRWLATPGLVSFPVQFISSILRIVVNGAITLAKGTVAVVLTPIGAPFKLAVSIWRAASSSRPAKA